MTSVCAFSQPPVKLTPNCSKVTGDLVLDKTAMNMTNLKEITGCLIMKNTNMTNYEFLSKIKVGKKCMWRKTSHDIKDNYCIPYKHRRLLNDTNPLKNTLEDNSNKQGCCGLWIFILKAEALQTNALLLLMMAKRAKWLLEMCI